jgi:hypothetical protein
LRIFLFTARLMWERAAGMSNRLWLIALILASVFILTPQRRIPAELISFAVLSPAVFLLPGWSDSAARKGIMAITTRGDGKRKVVLAEWVFPALSGTVASPPPWQFWIASPLVSTSVSLLLLTAEQYFRYPGRAVLCVLWLVQSSMSSHAGKFTDFMLLTDYPAAILLADPGAGSHHPDAFVFASLVAVSVSVGVYALFQRKITG